MSDFTFNLTGRLPYERLDFIGDLPVPAEIADSVNSFERDDTGGPFPFPFRVAVTTGEDRKQDILWYGVYFDFNPFKLQHDFQAIADRASPKMTTEGWTGTLGVMVESKYLLSKENFGDGWPEFMENFQFLGVDLGAGIAFGESDAVVARGGEVFATGSDVPYGIGGFFKTKLVSAYFGRDEARANSVDPFEIDFSWTTQFFKQVTSLVNPFSDESGAGRGMKGASVFMDAGWELSLKYNYDADTLGSSSSGSNGSMLPLDFSVRACDLHVRNNLNLPMPNCVAYRAGLSVPFGVDEVPDEIIEDTFFLEGLGLHFDYEYEQYDAPDSNNHFVSNRRHSVGLGVQYRQEFLDGAASLSHTAQIRPSAKTELDNVDFALDLETYDTLAVNVFDGNGIALTVGQRAPSYASDDSPYEFYFGLGAQLFSASSPVHQEINRVKDKITILEEEIEEIKKIAVSEEDASAIGGAFEAERTMLQGGLEGLRESLSFISDDANTLEALYNKSAAVKAMVKGFIKEHNETVDPADKISRRRWDPRVETDAFRSKVVKSLDEDISKRETRLADLAKPHEKIAKIRLQISNLIHRRDELESSLAPAESIFDFSYSLLRGVTGSQLDPLAASTWDIPRLEDEGMALQMSLLNGFYNWGVSSYFFQSGITNMAKSLDDPRETLWLSGFAGLAGAVGMAVGHDRNDPSIMDIGEMLLMNSAHAAIKYGIYPGKNDILKRTALGMAFSVAYMIAGVFTVTSEGNENTGFRRLAATSGMLTADILDFL